MSPTPIQRARRSLDGLSVGDAFGECFFAIALNPLALKMHLDSHTLPNHRWRWTDDTAMAVSIVEELECHDRIDADALADAFARRYAWDDRRGYGGTAHELLRRIGAGEHWSIVSGAVMNGAGSMGNGAAMRSAPLGAFLADDPEQVVYQADLSAKITHAHPEGRAGAIAVALAAAFVANAAARPSPHSGPELFDFVLQHTPAGQTRDGIALASSLPAETSALKAGSILGNGERLIAPETVPLCIWYAAQFGGRFEEAMWAVVSAGGDYDTNCAIVGGILASRSSGTPPRHWLGQREPLPAPLNELDNE
jgi:ADP-ribosylglycohydrolase